MKRLSRDRYLSDTELARFMAAVRERRHRHQPRDHAFFALLANTGIRPSEALRLTRADCHLEGRTPWIKVSRLKRRHGPTPTTELVLQPAVAEVLKRYIGQLEGDRLFPFSKRQPQRLFHYYGGKAGVGQSLKVYSLRHTVGMRLWRHTRDMRLIQAIMGHVRLSAAAAYVHVSVDQMRDGYAAAGVVNG